MRVNQTECWSMSCRESQCLELVQLEDQSEKLSSCHVWQNLGTNQRMKDLRTRSLVFREWLDRDRLKRWMSTSFLSEVVNSVGGLIKLVSMLKRSSGVEQKLKCGCGSPI